MSKARVEPNSCSGQELGTEKCVQEQIAKSGRSGQSVSLHRWREINEVHREENPQDREGIVYWDAWSPPQTRSRTYDPESSQPSQQTQTPSADASPSSIFRIPKEQRPPRRIIKPSKSRSQLSRQKAMAELKNVPVIPVPGTRSRVRAQNLKQGKSVGDAVAQVAPATAAIKEIKPEIEQKNLSDDLDDGFDADLLILASQQAEEIDRRSNNNMPETPKFRTSGRRSLGRNLNMESKPNVVEATEEGFEESMSMFESSTIEVEEVKKVLEQSVEVFDDADDEIFSQLNF